MIEYVQRESATYAELPHKFEAGTVNVGGAVGLHAAISYINSIGFDAIQQHENYLTALAFSQMRELPGIRIIGAETAEQHHGIITFAVDGIHPHSPCISFSAFRPLPV